MEISKNQSSAIIRGRRSTFMNGLMEGGKIADSVISELLENAVWAPTHGLVQAWFFKVYAGDGVQSFFKEQQRIYKETTPANNFKQMKYNKYMEKVKKISHIITIICTRDPKKRFPKQEDLISAACALQNIYLSLSAYNIGGYLSTGDICYTPQMREYLALGEEDECLGYFLLGIPDPNLAHSPAKRIPAIEKTQWITF